MHFDGRKQTVIILRHAHRSPFLPKSLGNDVKLTVKGKREARMLGRSFAQIPLGKVYTSPLRRCIQTIEELLKGAQQAPPIIQSKMLGDPGLFIEDPQQVKTIFLENTIQEIAQTIVNGQTLPGMRSLAEGGKLFLESVRQIKCFPCLMITHDIIICLLCCFFFRSKNVQKYLPGFLEGVSIELNPIRASLLRRKD